VDASNHVRRSLFGYLCLCMICGGEGSFMRLKKFCQVFIGREGECFGFIEFGIYLLRCSFFLLS